MEKINPELRIGEIKMMKCGMKCKIIDYIAYNNITVQFEDGHIFKNREYSEFKRGSIRNTYIPSVFGVGYLGDEKSSDGFGKHKYSYKVWKSMLLRCYSEKYRYKFPTYGNTEVCNEWHCFSNFEKWFDENYYEIKNEKTHLDKDILFKGNKIYSPSTCCFVPQSINKLFTKTDKLRGEYPIGVSYDKINKKYSSTCSLTKNNKKVHIYLGIFNTPEESFIAYKNYKENLIKNIANKYKDKIPEILYNTLMNYEVEITD